MRRTCVPRNWAPVFQITLTKKKKGGILIYAIKQDIV